MFTMDVTNKQKGSRVIQTSSSITPWTALKDKLSEIMNIHPTTLQAQYRLSTENKRSLLFDLTSQLDLDALIIRLRPLVVPPINADGRRSTRRMKAVSVQIFNKNDELQSPQNGSGGKVSTMRLVHIQQR